MEKTHFDTCRYISEGFYGANLPFYVPRTVGEHERMNYYGAKGFGKNDDWRVHKSNIEHHHNIKSYDPTQQPYTDDDI